MQAHQLGVSAGRQCILVACSSCHSYKITCRRPALPNIAAIPPRLDKARLPLRKSLLPLAATLQENIVESSAGTKVVKVKLMLQKKCEFGQQFNVVGDDELFGAWNPEASIPMQWSEGHIWTTELELSVGKHVEFKVILTGDQGVLEWQPGPNRVLETSEALSSLVISESWSAEEHIIQNDAPGRGHVREMHGLDIEDLNEIATSQELLPDLAEDIMIPVTESEGVNEEERDKKLQVSTMPVEVDAELPENQAADSALEDSFEDIETKPSVLEKDLKWGRKALSTLWGALVQKRSNEA